MSEELRDGKSSARWRYISAIIALSTAIFAIFLALSATRVDLISLFGFDFLFGPKDVFSLRDNIASKILANLIAAVGLATAFFIFRERAKSRAAFMSDEGTPSLEVTGNHNVVHLG